MEHTDHWLRAVGGGPALNVGAGLAARTSPNQPPDLSASVDMKIPAGLFDLKGDISGSLGRHGQGLSAGAVVAVPLGPSSEVGVGVRSSEFSPRDIPGMSFRSEQVHAQVSTKLGEGVMTGQVGAAFPHGGAPQPFFGIQFRFPFL